MTSNEQYERALRDEWATLESQSARLSRAGYARLIAVRAELDTIDLQRQAPAYAEMSEQDLTALWAEYDSRVELSIAERAAWAAVNAELNARY